MRRALMAVVGSGSPLESAVSTTCRDLGRLAIDAGFRIATGGRGGVMAAASEGAHSSQRYREGDVVAILPSYERGDANDHADVVITTGMGLARNIVLVASADVVVAVAGGSGTLSEIALAWQLGKPIIALSVAGGWSERVAASAIDGRRDDEVRRADSAEQAVELARELTEP